MKVSYELKQGYIDVWNEESEEWDRYIKENKKSVVEEKKIPEKLKDILHIYDLIPPVDENMYKIWKQTIKNHNKINEIIDCLKDKEE